MKKPNQGFTIIEVIIVMAIAGIILAIVLAAIPAFTRNGQNNQRKQDVASVLEAISRYQLNHSGTNPGAGSVAFLNNTKLSYYEKTTSAIKIEPYANAGASPSSVGGNSSPDTIIIHNYQKCDINTPGNSTRTGAGYYDVVALYAIETGSGQAPKCQQL